MASVTPKYDVAVSFLNVDEALAQEIYSKLTGSFEVFVYSKRQEQLAGTDGMESFRQAFLTDSRMVAVLYRDGWGETPWTRIEAAAIKDRFLEEGWDWLLFVMVDGVSTPPKWLPKSEIRLDYSQYGFDQLIGAIKIRAQKLGGAIRIETALSRAKRLEQDSIARADRDHLLTVEGWNAVQQEYQRLCTAVDEKTAELVGALTELQVNCGFDGRRCTISTQQMSVNFYLYPTQPVTESRIVLQEWNGRLNLPQERARTYFPGLEPQTLGKKEFYFDYQAAYGWCWRLDRSRNEFLTTPELAEHIIKQLLHIHDQFESGQIPRRENW